MYREKNLGFALFTSIISHRTSLCIYILIRSRKHTKCKSIRFSKTAIEYTNTYTRIRAYIYRKSIRWANFPNLSRTNWRKPGGRKNDFTIWLHVLVPIHAWIKITKNVSVHETTFKAYSLSFDLPLSFYASCPVFFLDVQLYFVPATWCACIIASYLYPIGVINVHLQRSANSNYLGSANNLFKTYSTEH